MSTKYDSLLKSWTESTDNLATVLLWKDEWRVEGTPKRNLRRWIKNCHNGYNTNQKEGYNVQRKVDPTYVSDLFENTDITNKCVNCSFKGDGRGQVYDDGVEGVVNVNKCPWQIILYKQMKTCLG